VQPENGLSMWTFPTSDVDLPDISFGVANPSAFLRLCRTFSNHNVVTHVRSVCNSRSRQTKLQRHLSLLTTEATRKNSDSRHLRHWPSHDALTANLTTTASAMMRWRRIEIKVKPFDVKTNQNKYK